LHSNARNTKAGVGKNTISSDFSRRFVRFLFVFFFSGFFVFFTDEYHSSTKRRRRRDDDQKSNGGVFLL
jgi:hypothetical protein